MPHCNRFLECTRKEAKRQSIIWPKVLRYSESQDLGVPGLKAQNLGVLDLKAHGLVIPDLKAQELRREDLSENS